MGITGVEGITVATVLVRVGAVNLSAQPVAGVGRLAIESAVVVSPFLVSAGGLPGHTFTVIVDVDTPAFKLASLLNNRLSSRMEPPSKYSIAWYLSK